MFAIETDDPISAHREGVTAVRLDDYARGREPCPLISTTIDVRIRGGFATVETGRTFCNDEAVSIEATLTFPIPIDAVLHALAVEIDGRSLYAIPQARDRARSTYEDAIDSGRLAILHEEVLHGVHMVSVGQLAPGARCTVVSTWSTITTACTQSRRLRIPTTVGEIYGRLPLNPADDLLPGRAVVKARLTVCVDSGVAAVPGALSETGSALDGIVDLGRALVIEVTGAHVAPIEGRSSFGRVVLDIGIAPVGTRNLDFAILFDRSSSTGQRIRADAEATVWSAMRDALAGMLLALRPSDRVTLYDFHTRPSLLGRASGPESVHLLEALDGPTGGTEIGLALDLALRDGASDILLLTDGRSGALDVHGMAGAGARISALLVGADSLEAMVGHLAALTGGHLACASGADAGDRLADLSALLRTAHGAGRITETTGMPERMQLIRGESTVTATWSQGPSGEADAVGAFAAAMALPSMERGAATDCAIAHGLCTHLTSLVIVDAAGTQQDAIPETRKVPLPCSTYAIDVMPAPSMPAPCMREPSMARPAASAPGMSALPMDVSAAPRRRSAPAVDAIHAQASSAEARFCRSAFCRSGRPRVCFRRSRYSGLPPQGRERRRCQASPAQASSAGGAAPFLSGEDVRIAASSGRAGRRAWPRWRRAQTGFSQD